MTDIDKATYTHIKGLAQTHGGETVVIAHILEAAAEVVYHVQQLLHAKTLSEQAAQVELLNNTAFDLKTWLIGFAADTGTMPWERES